MAMCRVVPVLAVALLALFAQVQSSNVLVLPMSFGFNSRLLNAQKVADMLVDHGGHNVTLLMNTKVMKHLISRHAHVEIYDVPEDIKLVTDMDMIAEARLTLLNTLKFANKWFDISAQFCDALLTDKPLLQKLKAQNFDLVFVDLLDDCGRIVLDYLGAPSIVYQNFGFMPETSVFFPQITSFVCSFGGMTCTTDHMTFTERTMNLVFLGIFNYVQYPMVYRTFNALRDKHAMDTCDVATTYSRSVVLINSDFVMEYPRPMMPNMFHISGLFHKEPSPLQPGLARFIEGSWPHGVVVLSFGTLVPQFETERAEMIARVFGRLKQRVIWRFTGTPPKALGNNTMLTEWFPQNDVLAHPLTKMFISHCGISSLYEAAYNSVPVVAVPLFFDQHYHAGKIVHRLGMALQLDYHTFTEEEFEWTLNEVLSNPIYTENAKKANYILSDQPVPPKDKLLHLFNYVIRHKGAKHLISDAAFRLNIFQLYSVDVIVMLCFCISLLIAGIIQCAARYCIPRRIPFTLKSKLQ